jgi:hypothetical protein
MKLSVNIVALEVVTSTCISILYDLWNLGTIHISEEGESLALFNTYW